MWQRIRGTALAAAVALWLTGCGGGGSSPPANDPPPVATHTVGGTVSGLDGTLTLRNNGGNDLSVTADGPFAFGAALAEGTAFSVTILTQPNGQNCTLSGGAGTVGSANVTSVAVVCTTTSPPPTAGSGSLDTTFGNGGKVTTDFSGAP